jgi:ABC-type uncharacterized transport system permease subunit
MSLGNRLFLGLLIYAVLFTIIILTIQPGIFQSFLIGLSVIIVSLMMETLAKVKTSFKDKEK